MNYVKLLTVLVLPAIFPGCKDNAPGNNITGPALSGKELGTAKTAEQVQMMTALKGDELRDYILAMKPTEKWDGVSPFKKGVRYRISADQQEKAQAMDEGYRKRYMALKKSIEERKAKGKSKHN